MAVTAHMIRISSPDLRKVQEFLDSGHKIKAIKHARANGREFPGREATGPDVDGNITTTIDHRPGLKNAKDAVEHLAGQRDDAQCKFVGTLRIKSFVVDTNEGEVEMDLDGLQLRLLGELNHIPMNDVAEMLEVVSFIRKWQGDIEE